MSDEELGDEAVDTSHRSLFADFYGLNLGGGDDDDDDEGGHTGGNTDESLSESGENSSDVERPYKTQSFDRYRTRSSSFNSQDMLPGFEKEVFFMLSLSSPFFSLSLSLSLIVPATKHKQDLTLYLFLRASLFVFHSYLYTLKIISIQSYFLLIMSTMQ